MFSIVQSVACSLSFFFSFSSLSLSHSSSSSSSSLSSASHTCSSLSTVILRRGPSRSKPILEIKTCQRDFPCKSLRGTKSWFKTITARPSRPANAPIESLLHSSCSILVGLTHFGPQMLQKNSTNDKNASRMHLDLPRFVSVCLGLSRFASVGLGFLSRLASVCLGLPRFVSVRLGLPRFNSLCFSPR